MVVLFAAWDNPTYGTQDVVNAVRAITRVGGPSIVVVGPPPKWKRGLRRHLLEAYRADIQHRIPRRMTRGLVPETRATDAALKTALAAENATYVSAWDVLCNAEGCITRLGEEPQSISAYDYGHFTAAAAAFVAARLPLTLP